MKFLFVLLPFMAMASTQIEVKHFEAKQRILGNGLVDITVTMQGSSNDVAAAECSFVATNIAAGVAIPVEHITRNGADAESGGIWTRKFIWEAQIDIGAVKIDDVALTVVAEIPVDCVRLWENGPCWAECNVGAMKPEEYGYYFWWGDTIGYKRNQNGDGWVSLEDSSSYSFNNCSTYEKDESQLLSEGYIDSTGNLVAAHDAATVHLGVPWRMPTDAEISALINNCTTTWTARNGVYGRLVTGKGAYSSKSIFLPAAGYGKDTDICDVGRYGRFWSSTPHLNPPRLAWQLYICQNFGSAYFSRYGDSRNYGLSVRPVRGSADVDASASSFMTTHLAWKEPLMIEGGPYVESVDGIKWTFVVNSNLEACVYDGSGSGAAVSRDVKGEITIPSKLGGRPVVSIGYYAFSFCRGLTKVSIPQSVREIGRSAFYYCSGLTEVTIPESVKEIWDNAFYYCQALSSLTIPKNLTSIGSDAFSGCSVENVYIEDISKWCEIDFGNPSANPLNGGSRLYWNDALVTNLTIPEGVVEISDFAFYNYDCLESVTIPNSVTNIGEKAFSDCGYLGSVRIGTGLIHVGAHAFSDYRGCNRSYSIQRRRVYISDVGKWCGVVFDDSTANPLCIDGENRQSILFIDDVEVSDLVIPSGVKHIGDYAFHYVYGLQSVVIPPSVESVGVDAFYAWREVSLQSVYIEDLGRWASIRFASSAANPLYFAKHLILNGDELTVLNITAGTTIVSDFAFAKCESITSVVIPNTVTNVGSYAFSGCSKLAAVSIPTSVKHFGATPFDGTAYWDSLKDGFVVINGSLIGYKGDCPSNLTIPEGVESICEGAFSGCAVTSVVFPNTLTRIDGWAFCDCPISTLKLPSGIKYIGKEAFSGQNLGNYEKYGSIGSVLIENVNDLIIDEQAFYGQNLSTVTISGSNVTIGNRAFYQTYDPQGSYRKDDWCNVSLMGSGIVVGEEAFANWMHGHAYANLTGVSAIGSKAFAEFGLRYRTSSSPWWEPGRSICVFSSELKHLSVDAFHRASIGRIYLDKIETLFGVDNWLAMDPFYCYYRIFRTGDAPSGWEDSWVYDGRSDLLEIEIPAGAEGIPAFAFCCLDTTSVTVPASVKTIGNDAFNTCKFLRNITFFGDAPEFVGVPSDFHGLHTLEDSVFYSVPKDECVVTVIEGTKGWDDDGDGKWQGFTLNYIPTPSYSITYEGTRGAANSNPATYKMTEEVTFSALSDREDARFIGWNPAKIERGSTGDKTVVACWETKTVSDMLMGCSSVALSGDANWFTKWTGSEWVLQSGAIADRQSSTLSCKVDGAGVLTFKWKVSSDCVEGWKDDYLNVEVDGQEAAWIGGEKGWIEQRIQLSANDKPHEVKWNYIKDKSGSAGDDCGWLKDVVWTPSAAPTVKPTVEGDEGATVTGDVESGFVIKPSVDKTVVEVTIPQGVEAEKVTVEVSPKVASVKPNGAKVKIVVGGTDITEFLKVPAADGSGVVDLTKATVKEEIVKEAMDVEMGAKIELDAADPQLTTSNTRIGLFYTFSEGRTLGGMERSASKTGDGQPWSPEIKVKGGNSAFYSIGISKGE